MKEYQRSIKKSVREMDRERNTLERQEKKLMANIKREAEEGQVESAKVMVKDLVRTRGYIKKMVKMKSHMEAVSGHLAKMSSSQEMATSMQGITKVMGRMNNKMNLAQMQKIMMEFEKQNELMGIDDAMDDAFADADSNEEDTAFGSILAELGVEPSSDLQKEIATWDVIFDHLYKDGNGYLDYVEAMAITSHAAEWAQMKIKLDQLFEDNSNKVSKSEFVKVMDPLLTQEEAKRIVREVKLEPPLNKK